MRHNGGCNVTIAAPSGLKMELAKKLDAADKYVELSRTNPEEQFEKLKKENPYGFTIVVEATGSPKILEDAINYVQRGGKLIVYGLEDPFPSSQGSLLTLLKRLSRGCTCFLATEQDLWG
jgi:D-arabinitol dehydrogenase (NADP+)